MLRDDLVVDLARRFEDAGVASLLFTDIGRDGLLKGVNIDATVDLDGEKKPGTVTRQPKINNLPANVRLTDYHPKDILVTIKSVPTE